ncbi:hypothetical protein BJF79_12205 [Actinomadura sp. CNU-125]|nr:hypothetical protein BJF79_12205 [Actinomadura sp. CNU-125]
MRFSATGSRAASAARNPASAGDSQPFTGSSFTVSPDLRWNHSDCIASKIGERSGIRGGPAWACGGAGGAGGGAAGICAGRSNIDGSGAGRSGTSSTWWPANPCGAAASGRTGSAGAAVSLHPLPDHPGSAPCAAPFREPSAMVWSAGAPVCSPY